ncbi:MAG: hypothetical protein COA79_14455 [Planctomycetota bacterium]|nr:MAG: hypothetical protein COA79_14455 [Planctomycetota bacterium]
MSENILKKSELMANWKCHLQQNKFLKPLILICIIFLIATYYCLFAPDNYTVGDGIVIVLSSMIIGIVSSLIIFIVTVTYGSANAKDVVTEFDSGNAGENRLEANLELKNTNHPLKNAQENEMFSNYPTIKNSSWPFWRISICIFLVLLIGIQFTELNILTDSLKESDANRKVILKNKILLDEKKILEEKKLAEEKIKNEDPAVKKEKAIKKLLDDSALKLTGPRSEMSATVLDEIVWSGIANAPHGFKSLNLDVFKNGELKASIPLDDDLLNKEGKLKLEEELLLDELGLESYDIVTYVLMGDLNGIEGEKIQINSNPHFIQIIPLAEERKYFEKDGEAPEGQKGKAGKLKKAFRKLMAMIKLQILLTRATYNAKASRIDIKSPVIQKQLKILIKEQAGLVDDIEDILENVPPEKMSPLFSESLKKAKGSMKEAESFLLGNEVNINSNRLKGVQDE